MRYKNILMICCLAAGLVLGGGWTLPAMAACPSELTAYWPLDDNGQPYTEEISGLNALCGGGGGNCPTRVAAGGVVLDGQQFSSGTDNLQVNASTGQDRPFDWEHDDSFSVEIWFNRSGNLANHEVEVIIGRNDTSTQLHWFIGLRRIGTQDKVITVLRAANGDGSANESNPNSSYLEGNDDVSNGQWHQAVLVKDGSQLRLYVDGTLNDSTNVTYAADTDFKSASANLNIGFLAGTSSSDYDYTFEGLLDEAAIYDIALDESIVGFHRTLGDSGLSVCEDQAPQFGDNLPEASALGYEFSFTAQAVGTPPITYTLKDGEYPVGMTIDETTGAISWYPSDQESGTVDFTVVASNSIDNTEKSFQVEILDLCATAISSYWQLNEATGPFGDNYDDPNTNPNDGACVGACPQNVASEIIGNAKSFNGTDQAISVATSADATFNWGPTDNFSMEMWMRRDGALAEGADATEVLMGRISAQAGGLFWFIGVRRNTGETVDRLIVQLRDKNGTDGALASTSDVVNGEWHHIVVVRDDVVKANRLYIDGQLEDTAENVDYDDTVGGFDDAAAALNIGWLDYFGTNTDQYSGRLDEIAFYDSALPASVIEQHFSANPPLSYCNAAPVIDAIPDAAVAAGEAFSYQPTASDDDGDTSFTWSKVSGPDDLDVDISSGEVTWTPSAADAGDNAVSIMVRDHRRGTAVQSFTITVSGGSDTNQAPVITGQAEDPLAMAKNTSREITLADLVASDPDGDTIQLAAVAEGDHYSVEGLTITPENDFTGNLTVPVTVTDGTATSDPFDLSVSVIGDLQITSDAPTSVTAGETYTYTPTVINPQGLTLTWTLTNAPSGMTVDPDTGQVTWTPADGVTSSGAVTLTVSDGSEEASQTFTVDVKAKSSSSSGGGGGGGGGCFIDSTRGQAPSATALLLMGLIVTVLGIAAQRLRG